jgi:hypothetical protein
MTDPKTQAPRRGTSQREWGSPYLICDTYWVAYAGLRLGPRHRRDGRQAPRELIRYASTKLQHRITRPPLAIGETP